MIWVEIDALFAETLDTVLSEYRSATGVTMKNHTGRVGPEPFKIHEIRSGCRSQVSAHAAMRAVRCARDRMMKAIAGIQMHTFVILNLLAVAVFYGVKKMILSHPLKRLLFAGICSTS
jgi:hypothetical protein